MTHNGDGTGGNPPSIKSYIAFNSDVSNNHVGWDAHAKTFMITRDGGYIAAGDGLSAESENAKAVGFVVRADPCQDARAGF